MTINTADSDDAEALRALIARVLLNAHTSMPCILKKFTAGANAIYCTIQVATMQRETIGGRVEDIPMVELENVPMVLPYAQSLGLSVTLPLQVGDEGMVHFCERSIDGWQQAGGVNPITEPLKPRVHDITDAVFVPGAISNKYAIDQYNLDAIEVRNADGGVALSVSQDTVQMRNGMTSITMPDDGKIYIVGDVVHSGNTSQTGKIDVSAGLETPADVKAGAISLKTHKHPINSGSSAPGPTGASVS